MPTEFFFDEHSRGNFWYTETSREKTIKPENSHYQVPHFAVVALLQFSSAFQNQDIYVWQSLTRTKMSSSHTHTNVIPFTFDMNGERIGCPVRFSLVCSSMPDPGSNYIIWKRKKGNFRYAKSKINNQIIYFINCRTRNMNGRGTFLHFDRSIW